MEKSDLIKIIEGFEQDNISHYDKIKNVTSINESLLDACALIGKMKAQLELVKIYLENCKIEEK